MKVYKASTMQQLLLFLIKLFKWSMIISLLTGVCQIISSRLWWLFNAIIPWYILVFGFAVTISFISVYIKNNYCFIVEKDYFIIKRPLKEDIRIRHYGHQYFFVELHDAVSLEDKMKKQCFIRILDNNGYSREYHCWSFTMNNFTELKEETQKIKREEQELYANYSRD